MVLKGYRGDVGIGTLIVFIAMVLVAAIAAAVLLNVSGMLQQRASATGKETTKQVSSNIIVTGISAFVNLGSSSEIENITITLKAASGSGRIDLRNMLIRMDNGVNEIKLTYNSSCAGYNKDTSVGSCYTMVAQVDPNGVFSAANPVIDPNAIVDVKVTNLSTANNFALGTRKSLSITLIPEIGTPYNIEVKTPEVYTGPVHILYP